jgi:predicted aspartyl protease
MKKPLVLSGVALESVAQLTDRLLLVDVTITLPNKTTISTIALVDSGANGYAFVDSSFAQSHKLPTFPTRKRTLNVVDGTEAAAGDITQISRLDLSIGDHSELQAPLFVTKLGQFPIILGIPWLRRHNPTINFRENYLTFHSHKCYSSCLPKGTHLLRVNGADDPNMPLRPKEVPESERWADPLAFGETPHTPPTPQDVSSSSCPRRSLKYDSIKMVGAAPFFTLAKKHGVQVFSASVSEIDRLLGLDTETEFQPRTQVINTISVTGRNEEIHAAFAEGEEVGRAKLASLYDASQDNCREAHKLYLQGASLEDVEKALAKLDNKAPRTDPKEKVPKHYHEYLYAFDRKAADKLPPHRPCDHKIELIPGSVPSWGPLYSMSQDELRVLKKWLEDNLKKGFIRASSSPASSPV